MRHDPPPPAQVDRITVTRVEYSWGAGTADDPVRRIVELHDGSGMFLRWDCEDAYVSHIPTELSQRDLREER